MASQKLKDNWLSILSLVVAITALSYNTWRNEITESNRNYRGSGFEIIKELAHLQLMVDQAFYGENSEIDHAIHGWTRINFIVSLSHVMPEPVIEDAINLKTAWANNWQALKTDEKANASISNANKKLEMSVLRVLESLN